jgi:hypothetical protein
VGQDVQDLPVWLAHEEAAHAPRLVSEWVHDLAAEACGRGMRSIDVVDLD